MQFKHLLSLNFEKTVFPMNIMHLYLQVIVMAVALKVGVCFAMRSFIHSLRIKFLG